MGKKMGQKIVFLQQSRIGQSGLHQANFTPGTFLSKDILANYIGQGFYARCGLDTWPWKFEKDFWHTVMPQTRIPDPADTQLDFATITDETAWHFRQTKFDRPWFIDWSGGIDSTAILVAVLKNFDRADYENVTVLMNAASVWENVDFYREHIVGNFRCINTHQFNRSERSRAHYRMHGDPGDMLWGATKGLQAKKDGLDLSRDWKRSYPAWQQFNAVLFGQKSADWIYRVMAENIESVPQYEIQSIADWYWWLNFNFKWIQKMLHDVSSITVQTPVEFFDCITPWYAQPLYQQWSLSRGRFGLLSGDIESYKIEAKDYIFAYDHNVYYRKFKTKFNSSGHYLGLSLLSDVWALTDQLQLLHGDCLLQQPNLIYQHQNHYYDHC